jgi:hypothetical protein
MNTIEQLISHCRAHRQGVPEGDLRDPRVLADVLTMLLEGHLSRLPASVHRDTTGVYDSLNGRVVRAPDPPPPDPKDNATACQLATLIGHLEDLR